MSRASNRGSVRVVMLSSLPFLVDVDVARMRWERWRLPNHRTLIHWAYVNKDWS